MSNVVNFQPSPNRDGGRPLWAFAAPPATRHPARRLTTFDDTGPPYRLPSLAYPLDALEPYCRAEALALHHQRHHAAYVTDANRALDRLVAARRDHDWSAINQLEADLAFNVSGHVLHSLFWSTIGPPAYDRPVGDVAVAIDESFGNFESFREQFTQCGLALQGSGWVALAWEPLGGCLVIEQIHDHQSAISQGAELLMVCDLWEHAYYLQYRQSRLDWLDAFWHIVNWSAVDERLIRSNFYITG
ncbi:MAG: superoxide dismutase, partial [Ilumatobacteraceae bacterium]